MRLNKKFLLVIFFSLIIYISFFNLKSYAGSYISQEEAEGLMPGVSELVNNLKASHPNYNFQFYNTGLEWHNSILHEYQGHGHSPVNLFNFSERYSGMWYCPVCGTKVYDNGSLSCASWEAIAYMMDARNSITEESVFQFKSLEIPDTTYDDIARMCVGTFLNNGECVAAILDASNMYNINAGYLVAKILTEQGTNGTTLSRGVVVNGTTYYNLFNIGAFGNKNEIITNGANYAASQGWSSVRDSILGGAQIVRDNYIGKGQNTCYYQKFNVVNTQSGLYAHQYAQNILSAENEGRKFKSYYDVNGSIIGNHTFIIPIYTGMPTQATVRPSTATKNSITYETGIITANGGVKVRDGEGTSSAQISSIPQDSTVKIISRGINIVDGYKWDVVISDENGVYGLVADNYIRTTGSGSNSGANSLVEYSVQPVIPSTPIIPEPVIVSDVGENIKIKENKFVISSNSTGETIKAIYPSAIIQDVSGNITEICATGNTINIDGVVYVIVKKGDINGDGDIDVSDVVVMLNHIKKSNIITDIYKLEAASVTGENEITVSDVVKELNYIKKTITDILVK